MNWTAIALVVAAIFVLYAVTQAVLAFTWSPARTTKRRRGPTYSPGETLWLVISAVFFAGLVAFAVL